jgi:Double zinc ribbon
MANQDDFMGRIKSNWQQRAGERTTFRAELRVIPRWPIRLVLGLYFLALAVVTFVALRAPQHMPPDLMGKPAAVKLIVMLGVVTVVAIAISIGVLFYGYIWADSKRRGMSPVLWLLVATLVPYLIGVILYFIVREPLPLNCPQCGRSVNPHFNFCPGCKFNLRANCPQCRRAIHAGDRFCPHCGADLQSDAPVGVGASEA